MFQKINNYILLRHPQWWNTRFVQSVCILLALHILYFLLGFASFNSGMDYYDFRDLNNYFTFFGIIITLIFIILWQNIFARNNAFVSYYPLQKNFFILEFLLPFIIFILACSIFMSFELGFYMHISPSNQYEFFQYAHIISYRDKDVLLGLLYISYGISTLTLIRRYGGSKNFLYSFIVGAIILALCAFTATISHSEATGQMLYYFCFVTFFVMYKLWKSEYNKKLATVMLNLFTTMVFSIPIVTCFLFVTKYEDAIQEGYYSMHKNKYYTDYQLYLEQFKVLHFIKEHSYMLMVANLVVVSILTILIFKHYYKNLHASAEE